MTGILATLRAAGSAEAFFAALDIAYDPAVLNVARLHILRRMRDTLRGTVPDALPDDAARAVLRDHLARAYDDFTRSTPIEQRVFKVHQDAIRPAGRGFVPLDAIMGS